MGVLGPNEPAEFRQAETTSMQGDIGREVGIHLNISSQIFPHEKIARIRDNTHPTFVWGKGHLA